MEENKNLAGTIGTKIGETQTKVSQYWQQHKHQIKPAFIGALKVLGLIAGVFMLLVAKAAGQVFEDRQNRNR